MTSQARWVTVQCSSTSWALISEGQTTVWKALTVNAKIETLVDRPKAEQTQPASDSLNCKLTEVPLQLGRRNTGPEKTQL